MRTTKRRPLSRAAATTALIILAALGQPQPANAAECGIIDVNCYVDNADEYTDPVVETADRVIDGALEDPIVDVDVDETRTFAEGLIDAVIPDETPDPPDVSRVMQIVDGLADEVPPPPSTGEVMDIVDGVADQVPPPPSTDRVLEIVDNYADATMDIVDGLTDDVPPPPSTGQVIATVNEVADQLPPPPSTGQVIATVNEVADQLPPPPSTGEVIDDVDDLTDASVGQDSLALVPITDAQVSAERAVQGLSLPGWRLMIPTFELPGLDDGDPDGYGNPDATDSEIPLLEEDSESPIALGPKPPPDQYNITYMFDDKSGAPILPYRKGYWHGGQKGFGRTKVEEKHGVMNVSFLQDMITYGVRKADRGRHTYRAEIEDLDSGDTTIFRLVMEEEDRPQGRTYAVGVITAYCETGNDRCPDWFYSSPYNGPGPKPW